MMMNVMMLNEHVKIYVDHHLDQFVVVVVMDMLNYYLYDMYPLEGDDDH
jgi:hypothetical protein